MSLNEAHIRAPFTTEQIANLNEFQSTGMWHPFTCGKRDDHVGNDILVATESGWKCPTCDYTQNWAWASMTTATPSLVAEEAFNGMDKLIGLEKTVEEN